MAFAVASPSTNSNFEPRPQKRPQHQRAQVSEHTVYVEECWGGYILTTTASSNNLPLNLSSLSLSSSLQINIVVLRGRYWGRQRVLHHGTIDWLNTQHKGLISFRSETDPPSDFVEKIRQKGQIRLYATLTESVSRKSQKNTTLLKKEEKSACCLDVQKSNGSLPLIYCATSENYE